MFSRLFDRSAGWADRRKWGRGGGILRMSRAQKMLDIFARHSEPFSEPLRTFGLGVEIGTFGHAATTAELSG